MKFTSGNLKLKVGDVSIFGKFPPKKWCQTVEFWRQTAKKLAPKRGAAPRPKAAATPYRFLQCATDFHCAVHRYAGRGRRPHQCATDFYRALPISTEPYARVRRTADGRTNEVLISTACSTDFYCGGIDFHCLLTHTEQL